MFVLEIVHYIMAFEGLALKELMIKLSWTLTEDQTTSMLTDLCQIVVTPDSIKVSQILLEASWPCQGKI